MACCAALTLLFSWGYRLVGWAVPGRDDEFAPVATWPPAPRERPSAATRAHRARPHQAVLGQVFIVTGIAWFVAGVLAMHVFGVLDIRSAPVDLAFHSSGLWLATVGVALRFELVHAARSAA